MSSALQVPFSGDQPPSTDGGLDVGGSRTPAGAGRIDAAIAHKRRTSKAKEDAVRAVLASCVRQGLALSVAEICRRADVNESFLYETRVKTRPVLRQEVTRTLEEIQARVRGQHARSGEETAADLRADLALAEDTNRLLRRQVSALERQLGKKLGRQLLEELPAHERMAVDQASTDSTRINELVREIDALKQRLDETTQSLVQARRLNREYMQRQSAQLRSAEAEAEAEDG